MNSNFKGFYEDIYEILQKYKEDALFLKAIPKTKEMINALEEDEDLFEKNFFACFSTEWQDFYFFVNLFEENKDDIKWYYENRGNYIRERQRYEYLDNDGEYKSYYDIIDDNVYFYNQLDEVLYIYNECIAGGYGEASSCLCGEDWFYILTHYTCDDKELPIKYALTYLTEYINSRYDKYKNEATKNRNIFKEIDEHISMLSDYAKDSVFLNEVPNIFEIIENLKSAKSKDEDGAYKIFWQLSNIRESIDLYKKNHNDMQFFHNNREISKFVPEYKDNEYNSYIKQLYVYIRTFENNVTLADFRRKITSGNIMIYDGNLKHNMYLKFKCESLQEFMEWTINEINKHLSYFNCKKPNLFDYATGELTNDAVICWMLDWANSKNKIYKSLSQDLIRLFTEKEDLVVKSVNIKRQYKNIDIVVEVNDSYVIVIEDKVNTSHHSNQLIRYKKIIENSEEYKDYNHRFIYFKVGNECEYNGVEEADYRRITRENILNIINRYKDLENNLLNDYIDYLENKELVFNKYKIENDINKWEWGTWEGYYSNLRTKKDIKEFCWHYVSNQSGGFLGFFWNRKDLKYIKDNEEIDYKLFLQIEANPNNNEIVRIAFKLKCEDTNYRKDIRGHVYNHLKAMGIEEIEKTNFKNGLHMTIAEIKHLKTREELDNMIDLSEKKLKILVENLISTT